MGEAAAAKVTHYILVLCSLRMLSRVTRHDHFHQPLFGDAQQCAAGCCAADRAPYIMPYLRGKGTDMAPTKPKQVASAKPPIGEYGLTKKQLAETIGLKPEALYKSSRLNAAKTQSRLREMNEILTRVSAWAGGPAQAMAWYRAEPIPAFGGRTAEQLVKSGRATALRDYLDSIAMGGFA